MSTGNILLVEDEFVIASATKLVLEDQGYRVVIAANGASALSKAEAERFDLVISDYMMPRMDGVTFTQALRNRGFDKPIILASAIPEDRLPPEARGTFDAFIEKPFVDATLIALVRRVLGERDTERS